MAKREMKTKNIEVTAPIEKREDDVAGSATIGTVDAKGYNKLNIRKAPKADAKVVASVDVGTKVTILDIEKAMGDWYKVKGVGDTGGFNGYCMKRYIKLD